MGKYQAYSEYKDSGVEWLGEVPSHWQLTRIKHIAELTPKKPNIDRTLECSFVPMEKLKTNSIILDEARLVNDVYDGYTCFRDGDILMAKVTPCFENKNIAVAEGLINGIGFGSSEIYVIRTNELAVNRYWYYRLQEDSFMDIATAAMTGAGGLKRVPSDVVSNFTAALPSLDERIKIANFLDHETAKIDTLIEKQQQLIQLLKEKRQAVISHAVTKGLNPNAPMKDSGVEWLGEVPEHWDVKRFKFLCEQIIAGPFGSSITKDMYVKSGYKVYGQEQVIPNDFSIGDYYISEKDYFELSRYIARPGDILISCVGTFGKIAVFPTEAEQGIINPRLIKAEIKTNCDPYYLRELLKSEMVFKQFELLSRGGTMGVINIAILDEILASVPPLSEQRDIVVYVNDQESKFEHLIGCINKQIELSQERRTALISAAVTGKIDVRNYSAQLT